ncbi:tRNA (adenosine(37)-N6)-dimethylallyltransferase MiaA [Candidatus Daviesbacteria bacterium]|nr:tRNA (adenosine(37)-N6)-dimethylallyltransferase MiaA [Candidatus Daviesbacteria bacterium]
MLKSFTKNKLLVILGPTSTGKTDLAISIAEKLNGEIVSADSRQVYKYLNIGTGKLPINEVDVKKKNGFWIMNGIKVWLYDLLDPQLQFNLYEYILEAKDVIKKISESGKFPILVGGTGLYIRSLLEGVSDFGTEKKTDLRKELEGLDIQEIINRILLLNPKILENLNNSEAKNARRLIRIFEKLSSPSETKRTFFGIRKHFNVLKVGLKVDRKILREKIRQRVLLRIDQGMLEESENLITREILTYERMEELGLEYKYIAKFLKGEIKSEKELVEILSLKIGQFAKRQMTWFKREKGVFWFDISEKNFMEKVEKKVRDWYN